MLTVRVSVPEIREWVGLFNFVWWLFTLWSLAQWRRERCTWTHEYVTTRISVCLFTFTSTLQDSWEIGPKKRRVLSPLRKGTGQSIWQPCPVSGPRGTWWNTGWSAQTATSAVQPTPSWGQPDIIHSTSIWSAATMYQMLYIQGGPAENNRFLSFPLLSAILLYSSLKINFTKLSLI